MRRLLLLAIVFLSAQTFAATLNGCNGPSGGASSGSTAVASNGCTLLSGLGNNHIVLVFYSTFGTGITPTLSTSPSLTCSNTGVSNSWDTTVLDKIDCCFTGTTHTGAALTVTVSYSSNATFSSVIPAEETDVTFTSCAAAIDAFSSPATGTGSGTVSSNSATSTVASDTIFEYGNCNAAGATMSAGSGFTQQGIFTGLGPCGNAGYKTAGAAGSQTATFSLSTSATWVGYMLLIKPGNSAPTSPGIPFVL